MTTSPHDGECLNAIRKANSILAEANLNWREFLTGNAVVVTEPKPYAGEAKRHRGTEVELMISVLLQSVPQSSSFFGFVESVASFYVGNGFVTEKQYAALKRATAKRSAR